MCDLLRILDFRLFFLFYFIFKEMVPAKPNSPTLWSFESVHPWTERFIEPQGMEEEHANCLNMQDCDSVADSDFQNWEFKCLCEKPIFWLIFTNLIKICISQSYYLWV